jgi:hypothetical protein
MRRRFFFLAPLFLLAFLAFIAVGGLVVRELWNWLVPALFGWRSVTFWQALGLLALCRILFGGFGVHGSSGSSMGRRMARSRIRRRMAERWEQMTPEQRERCRQSRARWGFHPSADEGPEQ